MPDVGRIGLLFVDGRVVGAIGGAAALLAGAGVAAFLLTHHGEHAAPGTGAPTSDDEIAPAAWKDEVASFVYTAKNEGEDRMFSIEGQVLGGSGFQRIGTSFEDAVAAGHAAAQQPLSDGIHKSPVNQAQGVFQARDGAYWIAPLGGFHRGAEDAVFIDGPFWEQHGITVDVLPHTTDLKAVVGATQTIDLRDVRR